jgi:hypothetical protein
MFYPTCYYECMKCVKPIENATHVLVKENIETNN